MDSYSNDFDRLLAHAGWMRSRYTVFENVERESSPRDLRAAK